MTSPVARMLREHYPNAHIAWVVEPLSAPIVQANPYVDEVIHFPWHTWTRLRREKRYAEAYREIRTFLRTLQARHFDITIDCQGLLKSGLLSWFSHAPQRIGPAFSREGSHLFTTASSPWPKRPTHLADKYVAMLAPLGIEYAVQRPILEIPAATHAAARQLLAEKGLVAGTRYVACCVLSTRPQKDWVWSRWGELADRLWEREGLRTVLIGGREGQQDAERLTTQYASKPISLVGKAALLDSAAVVQGAVGVVGVDTGLTYAGMPIDLPTVALYGSTDATWLTEEPHTVICLHKMDCSPCNRHPSCANFDCMRAITVEEVAQALCARLGATL
ncbi:MAG TPA: glycosyltransferase family 9 protein [Armatimonadota bacterium]